MTRERIKDFKEIILPFFTNYLLKKNYENLGKSDAEEFEKDFSEIIELADKALEQQPCEDTISRQAAIDALQGMAVPLYKDPACEDIWERDRTLDNAIDAIRGLPSAQPEIVRCHKCIYWDRDTVRQNSNDAGWWNEAVCKRYSDEIWTSWKDADWYCADAERKNDG